MPSSLPAPHPRSRPVIHVIRDMSIDPQYIDLEQRNCKGRTGVW